MNFNQQLSLTFQLASRAGLANWPAWLALLGMLLMIAAMVGMMWFLSQPVVDLRAWLCGGASIAGLGLWRSMLPLALARDA